MTNIMRSSRSTDLASHVREGLASPQKFLSSQWFYDDEGSRLFQEITRLPEYYLARTEHALLAERAGELVNLLAPEQAINLIELGSGDGTKVIALLRALYQAHPSSLFSPMDVSAQMLNELAKTVAAEVPGLLVSQTHGDYLSMWPSNPRQQRQAVMLLGSNLGNFDAAGATAFLCQIRAQLRPGDALLLGVDFVKAPELILAAYNDTQGVTARFNLNLLRRLNRELGMDFDLTSFRHYPCYSPLDGTARSFLVSTRSQVITSTALGSSFAFAEGETIYTEQSQKYSRASLELLTTPAGFSIDTFITDSRDWYGLVLCRAVG